MPKHATLSPTGYLPAAQLGSGSPTGAKYLCDDGSWKTVAGGEGAVNSVFGRSGNVAAQAADYDSFFMTPAECAAGYAALSHHHDAAYAALSHTHAGVYSPVAHNHDAAYSALGHTHAGVYQPLATPLTNTTAAFTTAQETKLAGIATAATANATDAQLRDRSTHSGTQAASTISDFTEASQDVIGAMITAAGGSYNDGANTITLPAGGAAPVLFNQSVAQQQGFATDTYLAGSSIATARVKVGTRYHLIFDAAKTAAGTATPIITVRYGTAGAIGDTARATLTFLAGTAAADDATFDVWITFRVVGASAVIQAVSQCRHRLSVTGFQVQPGTTVRATSGTFDSGVANSIIGVSVNGGASASWTVQLVQAELENLT